MDSNLAAWLLVALAALGMTVLAIIDSKTDDSSGD